MMSRDLSRIPDALKKFSVTISQRVSWGDMDAYGHVNNTKYFRYFEDVRLAYFENIQKVSDVVDANHVGIVVANTSCKFKRPIRYPDQLHIGAKIVSVDETRFTMQYAIFSEQLQAIAATGDALLVSFDLKEHAPVNLTEQMLAGIQMIEGSDLK